MGLDEFIEDEVQGEEIGHFRLFLVFVYYFSNFFNGRQTSRLIQPIITVCLVFESTKTFLVDTLLGYELTSCVPSPGVKYFLPCKHGVEFLVKQHVIIGTCNSSPPLARWEETHDPTRSQAG